MDFKPAQSKPELLTQTRNINPDKVILFYDDPGDVCILAGTNPSVSIAVLHIEADLWKESSSQLADLVTEYDHSDGTGIIKSFYFRLSDKTAQKNKIFCVHHIPNGPVTCQLVEEDSSELFLRKEKKSCSK